MSTIEKIILALNKAKEEKQALIDGQCREINFWTRNEFELFLFLIKQNARDGLIAPVESKSQKRKSSDASFSSSNQSPELKRQSVDFEAILGSAGLPSDLNKLKKEELQRELNRRGKKSNSKDTKPILIAALKDALLEEHRKMAPRSTETAPAVTAEPLCVRKGSLMSDFRKQVNNMPEPSGPTEVTDLKLELQRRRDSQAARKSTVSIASEEMQMLSPVQAPRRDTLAPPSTEKMTNDDDEEEEEGEDAESDDDNEEEVEAEEQSFSDVESEVDEVESEPVQDIASSVVVAVAVEDEEIAETLAPSNTTIVVPSNDNEDDGSIALDYSSPVQSEVEEPMSLDVSVVSESAAAVTTVSEKEVPSVAAVVEVKAPVVMVNKPLNLVGAKPVKSTVGAIEQAKKLKEQEEAKALIKKQKLEALRAGKPIAVVSSLNASGSTKSTTSTTSSNASDKTKMVNKPTTTTTAAQPAAIAVVAAPVKAPIEVAPVKAPVQVTAPAPVAAAAPLVVTAPAAAPVVVVKEVPAPPAAAPQGTPKKTFFGAIFGTKSPQPVVAKAPVVEAAPVAVVAPKKSSFDISVVETKTTSPSVVSPEAPFTSKPAATAAPAAVTVTSTPGPMSMMSPTKPDPFKSKANVNNILENFKQAQAAQPPAPAPIVDLHKAAAVLKPTPAVVIAPAVKPVVIPSAPAATNSSVLKDITTKITGAAPQMAPAAPVQEMEEDPDQYPIVDRESSDEEGGGTDEEGAKKMSDKIPNWARGAQLKEALDRQYGLHVHSPIDPDTIFFEVQTCSLEAIFGISQGIKNRKYSARSSSAHWDADSMTLVEKRAYREHLGFGKNLVIV